MGAVTSCDSLTPAADTEVWELWVSKHRCILGLRGLCLPCQSAAGHDLIKFLKSGVQLGL